MPALLLSVSMQDDGDREGWRGRGDDSTIDNVDRDLVGEIARGRREETGRRVTSWGKSHCRWKSIRGASPIRPTQTRKDQESGENAI